MSKSIEITGEYIRQVAAFDNVDSRTVIAEIQQADNTVVTVKGKAESGSLKTGLTYRFYGRWTTHWKYGQQFAFKSFVNEKPATKKAVCVYLQQCKGIAWGIASRLWEAYGSDAVEVLRTDPGRCASEIKGLTADKANAASDLLNKHYRTERAKMDLLSILNGRGFPKRVIDHALKDYGAAAADRISHNPYLLMRYKGCGFLLCDKMYLDLGKPAGRLKRQALCAWHAVASNSSGDTWIPVSRVRDGITRNVSGADANVSRAVMLTQRANMLVTREDMATTWVAEKRKAWRESELASHVADMVAGVDHAQMGWPDVGMLNVSEHQAAVLSECFRGRLGILAGGPGTGKTHCTAEVIRYLTREIGCHEDTVLVVAPTGKAAVRMSEGLSRAGVHVRAMTIHSALQVQSTEDGWSFSHNRNNPLPHSWIFVDEASMLDTDLAYNLISAVDGFAKLMVIGDPNQLPPVGHGAPLRDMIAAGVPCGVLTETRRNSGRIVETCRVIRERKRFESSDALSLDAGENLLHVERATPEEQIETLEKTITRLGDSGKYDRVWDVQVLCAVNKKSPLARNDLNKRLQELLNPTGQRAKGNPFRVGDKVINLKNDKFPSVESDQESVDKDGNVYVANGEQGEVVEVTPARTIVKLEAPSRLIIVPRSAESQRSNDESDDESGAGDDSTGSGCSWDLGYAISVHKSQGSEWPVVLVLADESGPARRVQTRNWIYTAISRAKLFCLTIGRREVIDSMMRVDGISKRKTFLAEEISREVVDVRSLRVAEWVQSNGLDIGDVLEGVC